MILTSIAIVAFKGVFLKVHTELIYRVPIYFSSKHTKDKISLNSYRYFKNSTNKYSRLAFFRNRLYTGSLNYYGMCKCDLPYFIKIIILITVCIKTIYIVRNKCIYIGNIIIHKKQNMRKNSTGTINKYFFFRKLIQENREIDKQMYVLCSMVYYILYQIPIGDNCVHQILIT